MKSAAIVIAFALLALAMSLDLRAQAAEPDAPPVSDNCIEVANVGLLDVYFCESDFGNFFVNSFGFMMTEY